MRMAILYKIIDTGKQFFTW